jgi:aryl-alcohol dehydrogenase-like predicted oxidoreductase
MKYRTLGRTGFEVSDIGTGLWGMSGWSDADTKQARQALQLAIDLGCNFFDTAWADANGPSDGYRPGEENVTKQAHLRGVKTRRKI